MELVDASTGEHLDEGWRLQAAVCGSATCARNSGWRVRLCRDVVGAISEPPVENRAASQQPAGSEIRPYQRRNPLLVGAQHLPPPVPGEHPTWLAPSVEGKELFIGWRLWCNCARQSHRRKPRPRRQWCFEKPVGEHGSFGFAVRALVRPGSDP